MITNKFEQFLKNRQSLIEQYTKGDLSKDEFIEENFRCVHALGIQPFQKIDSVKKAIYNYQYYNVLAKYYQKKSHDLSKRNTDLRDDYSESADYYYSKKDMVTEKLLKLLDFQGVEAYFVKVNSPNLKNKLFEIVLKDYDDVILHSKNERILAMLIAENAFSPDHKKSVIDSYINQKY